jgi:hypothetical protein
MPQETKARVDPGSGESAGEAGASLYGWQVDMNDPVTGVAVLEKAFDYRGDVTLRLLDGSAVMGYIFDRKRGDGMDDSYVRLMTVASDEKIRIAFSNIRRVEFSGKDAAHGKSFETWVKKYIEKKTKGERASIEAEAL